MNVIIISFVTGLEQTDLLFSFCSKQRCNLNKRWLGSVSLIRDDISHSAPELCSSLVHYILLRLK